MRAELSAEMAILAARVQAIEIAQRKEVDERQTVIEGVIQKTDEMMSAFAAQFKDAVASYGVPFRAGDCAQSATEETIRRWAHSSPAVPTPPPRMPPPLPTQASTWGRAPESPPTTVQHQPPVHFVIGGATPTAAAAGPALPLVPNCKDEDKELSFAEYQARCEREAAAEAAPSTCARKDPLPSHSSPMSTLSTAYRSDDDEPRAASRTLQWGTSEPATSSPSEAAAAPQSAKAPPKDARKDALRDAVVAHLARQAAQADGDDSDDCLSASCPSEASPHSPKVRTPRGELWKMDNGLQIQPGNTVFFYTGASQAAAKIKLSNGSLGYVAFRVVAEHRAYTLEPMAGVLQPGQAIEVLVRSNGPRFLAQRHPINIDGVNASPAEPIDWNKLGKSDSERLTLRVSIKRATDAHGVLQSSQNDSPVKSQFGFTPAVSSPSGGFSFGPQSGQAEFLQDVSPVSRAKMRSSPSARVAVPVEVIGEGSEDDEDISFEQYQARCLAASHAEEPPNDASAALTQNITKEIEHGSLAADHIRRVSSEGLGTREASLGRLAPGTQPLTR